MEGQVWPGGSLYAKQLGELLRNNLVIGREVHERRQREWDALPEREKRRLTRAARMRELREKLARQAYETISGQSFPDYDDD